MIGKFFGESRNLRQSGICFLVQKIRREWRIELKYTR